MDKLLLPVLLGTNRKNRNSAHPARWLVGEMEKRPEIQTKLFDASDFAMPHDDYGQELKDLFPEWRDTIIQADGLVIVSPEYRFGVLTSSHSKGGPSLRVWTGTHAVAHLHFLASK